MHKSYRCLPVNVRVNHMNQKTFAFSFRTSINALTAMLATFMLLTFRF